jgi:NADPH:quinone reductase-like Zn-dependent oxidoreductase
MQVARRTHYGPPERIRIADADVPRPREGEVLIRLHATTVNRTDCANLTARPLIMRFVLGLLRPRIAILGTDFAGEVIAVGREVTAHVVGDRVFGFIDTGAASQATYTVIPERQVFPIPPGIDYRTAAASLEGAHYAYSFLRKAGVEDGQRVLINGATGAIGSALLQFVRRYDVHVTVTCRGAHAGRVRELGAAAVVDYTKENVFRTDGTYERVFDAVGKSTFGAARGVMAEKSVYVSSEFGPYAQNLYYALTTGRSDRRVIFPVPLPTAESVPFISQCLAEGSFAPLIDRSYPPERIAEAYKYVMRGQKVGNVVIAYG